jgi:hypothetical protein
VVTIGGDSVWPTEQVVPHNDANLERKLDGGVVAWVAWRKERWHTITPWTDVVSDRYFMKWDGRPFFVCYFSDGPAVHLLRGWCGNYAAFSIFPFSVPTNRRYRII